jgi:hypothetical protein
MTTAQKGGRPHVSIERLIRGNAGITPSTDSWYKANCRNYNSPNGTALRRKVLEAFEKAPEELKRMLLEVTNARD